MLDENIKVIMADFKVKNCQVKFIKLYLSFLMCKDLLNDAYVIPILLLPPRISSSSKVQNG